MYFRLAIKILLILLIPAVQFSFIAGLPAGLNNLNIILLAIIFILALSGFGKSVWWALSMGIFMDIISFSAFGLFTLSFLLVAITANFLLDHFFTNRSLYSFIALTTLTICFYNLIYYIFKYLGGFLNDKIILSGINENFWYSLLAQIVFNLLAVLIIFYVINYSSNRLKPVFLQKNEI